MKTFSDRLVQLIHDCGVSQKEISEKTEISASALANYKKDRTPKSEELYRLAKFFAVSMEWLISGEGAQTKTTNEKVNHGSPATKLHLEDSDTEVNHGLPATNLRLEESNGDGNQFESRRIPLVGWAHAGEAVNYDEHPDRWDNLVCTDCKDSKAFAVELEGDSMEPFYTTSDILVVTPSERVYSGRLVVVRFRDFGDKNEEAGGVLFRRLEYEGENVILRPLNESYPVKEYHRSDFEWIYPVWGRWTQTHK